MVGRGISPQTAEHWRGVGKQRPLQFELFAFCLAFATFFVTIFINAFVANEEGNDYASDAGWWIMMPAPSISLLWALLNINILLRSTRIVFHPGYAITKAFLDFALNVIVGFWTAAMWYFNAGWMPSIFMFATALLDLTYLGVAAHAIRMKKRAERVASRAPPRA